MHERTERTLCRLAFLVLCALPTLLTVAFAVVSKTPWYYRSEIAAIEQVLSQRLGVGVSIGELRRPSPGAWQLEQITLSDPETGAEVAVVRTAFYAVVDGEVRIHLSQPQMYSDQLPLVWRIVHDRFLCQPALLGTRLRLRAQDFSVLSQPQGLTLSPVDVWIEPGEDKISAGMRFSMVGGAADERPAELSVTRLRGTDGQKPKTRWELRSGSRPLPCGVLADYLPAMRRLGVDAQFSGLLRWEVDRSDYFVQLQNARFSNVSMLDLFEHFDYHVSGLGTIELQNLIRYGGQPVSQASGKLTIENGKLELGLVQKLAAVFQAQVTPQFAVGPGETDASRRIETQMVALEFNLHGPEIELTGACGRSPTFEAMPPGTAIVAAGVPLLHLDPRYHISSDQLTAALDPQGRTGLPIGQPTDWTEQVLPRLSDGSEAINGPPKVRGIRLNRDRF